MVKASIQRVMFGKVRDSAVLSDGTRLVRTSDRISAFDMMMPFLVSGKGSILQDISLDAFASVADLMPHHILGVVDDRTIQVRNLSILPIEFVVRRYLTGSLWRLAAREGHKGLEAAYGLKLFDSMPELKEHARFERPILTPTSKALHGHDMPMNWESLVPRLTDFLRNIGKSPKGGVGALIDELQSRLIQVFERGEEVAARKGLILVDTKYEVGLDESGQLVLADEIHTPDSSRFWTEAPKDGRVRQLSKEFLREELMGAGIVDHDELCHDGVERLREVSEKLSINVAARYQELRDRILGVGGQPADLFPSVDWPCAKLDFESVCEATSIHRLLVVGNGARDFSLMSRFSSLPGIASVACSPGERSWRSRQIPVANWVGSRSEDLIQRAQRSQIDLVLVGPELPVAQGIAFHAESAGLACLAPGLKGASLEASKVLCKQALVSAGIPTASSETVSLTQLQALPEAPFLPCVLKFDGLASGKGVFMIDSLDDWKCAKETCQQQASEWMAAVRSLECPSASAKAGEPLFLIEESLKGVEYSIFALCNGREFRLLPVARDYKRRNNDQVGPNTGGMGSVAPVFIPDALLHQFSNSISKILAFQESEGEPYRGFLFGGFMVDEHGVARVLEFNARLGDPETQVILPGLGDDFLVECIRTAKGQEFFWKDRTGTFFEHDGISRVYVVGAAPEYPISSSPHRKLRRMDREDVAPAEPRCSLIPASLEPDGRSKGGRVFGILAEGTSIPEARALAYAEMSAYLLGDEPPHFRTDIAREFS